MSETLNLEQVEEMVNLAARKYGRDQYGIPARAIRVILWPTDQFICTVERGPTAIIRFGILPNHPQFMSTLRSAVSRIHRGKMWESMEVESIASICKRNAELNRNLWKLYSFDPSTLRGMLQPEEMTMKVVTRIEVSHHDTKLKEIVELGPGDSIMAMRKLAAARLSRRVAEARVEVEKEVEPWNLPSDHPDWVAQPS